LDEPVVAKVQGIGFESPHNQPITWMQLLQQTSEWEGNCFGVPDQVDRYRHLQYRRRAFRRTVPASKKVTRAR
jgi:hypothetical protein